MVYPKEKLACRQMGESRQENSQTDEGCSCPSLLTRTDTPGRPYTGLLPPAENSSNYDKTQKHCMPYQLHAQPYGSL